MEEEAVRIESVYEENTCTTCGRFGVDQYSSIVDNYIKYRNKLVSFIEIIRVTLDFQPTPENCSMEICDQCKAKLQEFYNFKMRSTQARKVKDEATGEGYLQKLLELDKEIADPLVYNTVKIVRDYIGGNSVKYIQVEENPNRLLVITPVTTDDEQLQSLSQNETADETIQERVEEEEALQTEYLLTKEEQIETTFNESEMECEETAFDTCSTTSSKPENTAKRPRRVDEWKCNKRKKLRNSGQAYVNTKGNVVEERKMRPSCVSCRNRCTERLTERDREMSFNRYWQLGDVVEQRKFIFTHIVSKQPSRRRSVKSNRSVTLEFYLDKVGETAPVHVCKKMFKNTLSVSNQVIQCVVNKYAASNFVDHRGKHERKLTEAQELAKEHVEQFPFFYVEQTMTKVQLYNMYVKQCKERNIVPVKESNYREIFDRHNSNSFLKAEKILCEKCHQYFKATDEERVTLQKEHDAHIAADKKCRDRALGRIRHRRSIERKRAERLKTTE